ncbi:unnamed protein product [Phytophthora fragariaefolia]|uniref:Unnamed protein product n=1 Tax=Phytophthora fragariaefolia TaxID=1490495 RepID=A0A9W6Y2B7_9STRA|nr:unnamed protein product [Phytophthora fragariaefolia]
MDDRYDLILGMPWLAKHEPWIDWRSRTIGASNNPLADRALAGHAPSSSRDGFLEVGDDKDPQDPRTPPVGRQGSAICNRVAYVQGTVTNQGADVATARAGKGGSIQAPPMQSMVAGSAHADEGAGVVARANKSGRVGAPTTQGVHTKAETSSRDADSAAEGRAPQVVDAFTGEPKVGEALTPLPTVAELLELEELSYVEVFDSLKAGELPEVVLHRPEGGAMEFNSSSVMDSEVLEDERTSKRQTDDPPSILPPDRGVRHEIDLVPGTKYCTTRQWPLPKEQVDVIDAFFAAKHAAGMVRETKSPHSSPTFCVRISNGKWCMVHAFNKLNAATVPASTPIPRKDVLQNNMAGCMVFSALDMVDGYYQFLMRESDIPLTADLCKWLGLANYLHKYSANYADMARPLANLLKKDAVWSWTSEAQQAFEAIKGSLQSAPILALPDEDRPFSVVCDASDFAISCALLQVDAEGRERVVSFQSRQLKAAEKNYPVHDKELLAMKYALVKFRVHLLGKKPFVIYTDHTSLRTATSSPHLSQRMARWLSFFAEYNFTVEYKPGKQNVLADALSRRPDYELAHLAYLESPLYELIRDSYAGDGDLAGLVEALSVPSKTVGLTARQRSCLHRYSVVEGLLYYQVDVDDEPQLVVPDDEDLRYLVHYEAHDTPLSGHLGREKAYTSVARNFWWPHMLDMSTADHPQTDGQTERVNRVLEDVLRSVCAAEPTKWSTLLPQVEFALNNAVHSSTGFTPFYVNGLRHPRTPLTLLSASNLDGGEANAEAPRGLQGLRTPVKRNMLSFIETGEPVRQRVRDAMAAAQDTQKEPSDHHGPATSLRGTVHGHAYTLNLPSSMATHPTFYVGLLKPYRPAGAAEPVWSTASPSTDGRRPPSPEQTVPREPGRERESERQLEPLRGVRLASPSGPPGHTDSGSRRGASPSLGAPIRRSPRLANIGPAGGRLRHQDGISAQATPTRGLADGLSPGGHPGASPGGSQLLGRERAAPPSQSAGHPAVVDRTPNRPEGSPGQDGSRSVDAVRPGRTPLPSRSPPPLLGSEGALYYHVEKLLKRRGRIGQYQGLRRPRGRF